MEPHQQTAADAPPPRLGDNDTDTEDEDARQATTTTPGSVLIHVGGQCVMIDFAIMDRPCPKLVARVDKLVEINKPDKKGDAATDKVDEKSKKETKEKSKDRKFIN